MVEKKIDPLKRDNKGKRKTGQRAKGEKRKGLESSPAIADNTKTRTAEKGVLHAPIAPMMQATRRTAIIRIVGPRTAPPR